MLDLGTLASLGGRLAEGAFGAFQQSQNRDLQREFAKSGIQWRVADAKAAGIHPIYALGASTASPSVTAFSPLGAAAGAMGQDISRAVRATANSGDRGAMDTMGALALERAGLQNDLLKAQIASINARSSQAGQVGPAMPTPNETETFRVPQDKVEGRPPIMMGGSRLMTDPGTSPAKAFEDLLGDDFFSPGFLPNLVGALKQHYGQPESWPMQVMSEFWRRFSSEAKDELGNLENFVRMLKRRGHQWMINNADRR